MWLLLSGVNGTASTTRFGHFVGCHMRHGNRRSAARDGDCRRLNGDMLHGSCRSALVDASFPSAAAAPMTTWNCSRWRHSLDRTITVSFSFLRFSILFLSCGEWRPVCIRLRAFWGFLTGVEFSFILLLLHCRVLHFWWGVVCFFWWRP